MNGLSDRAKGQDAEFKHRDEMAFRVTARRNRLFGLWAASRRASPAKRRKLTPW